MALDSGLLGYLILAGLFLLVFLLYRPHRVRKKTFLDQLRAQYGAKVGILHTQLVFKGYLFTVSARAMSHAESLVRIVVSFPRTLIGSVAFYPMVFGQINLSPSLWGLREAMTLTSGEAEFRARTDNAETIQRLQENKEIWDALPGLIFQSKTGMIMVDAHRKTLTLEGLDLEWVMHSPETYFLLSCQIVEALDMSAVATDGFMATQPG